MSSETRSRCANASRLRSTRTERGWILYFRRAGCDGQRSQLSRGACKPGSVPDAVSLAGPLAKAAAIHLGGALLRRSSDQPGLPGSETDPLRPEGLGKQPLFGLAPGGVCRAACRCRKRGALLPHPFTLASPLSFDTLGMSGDRRSALCGTFPDPDLRRGRRALPATFVSWSPDFPRRCLRSGAAARLPGEAHLARPVSRSNRSSKRIPPISPSISPSISPGLQRR